MGPTIANDRLYRTASFGTADLFANYTLPWRKGEVRYRLGITNLTDDDAVIRLNSAAAVYREEGRFVKLSASYLW